MAQQQGKRTSGASDRSRKPQQSSSATPRISSSGLARTVSERQAQWSDKLLSAIEHDTIAKVREELEEETKESDLSDGVLTEPNLVEEHKFRTPLMAAVVRKDLPIFMTLLRRFDTHFSTPSEPHKCWDKIPKGKQCPQKTRHTKIRTQLELQDAEGNNLAMLAAQGGNMAILKAVMDEIQHTRAAHTLEQSDHEGRTLLMHAASVGSAHVFRVVLGVYGKMVLGVYGKNGKRDMSYHLTRRSGDGRTILMYVARSGNAEALCEVAKACQAACDPKTVRHILYRIDTGRMNFLMHSAAGFEAKPTGKAVDDVENPRSPVRQQREAPVEPPAEQERGESQPASASGPGPGDADAEHEDPAVPLFNAAMDLVTRCLWKEERRMQLSAKDLQGRTVLTHAIRSGRGELFDAVLTAVRDNVLESEVEKMMDTSEDNLKTKSLRSALARGGKEMKIVFDRRSKQLKATAAIDVIEGEDIIVRLRLPGSTSPATISPSFAVEQADIGLRAKLSSIEAKIQSFIPGKLIVIFQLLLPEMGTELRKLWLLIAMSVTAPIWHWAGSLVTTEPKKSKDPRSEYRRSNNSWILGAPALFFWGVGTSTIGNQLGWDASLSAALLAVATIVIPVIDAFFNSEKIVLLYEKANREWRRKQQERRREEVPTTSLGGCCKSKDMCCKLKDMCGFATPRVQPDEDEEAPASSYSANPSPHYEDEGVQPRKDQGHVHPGTKGDEDTENDEETKNDEAKNGDE